MRKFQLLSSTWTFWHENVIQFLSQSFSFGSADAINITSRFLLIILYWNLEDSHL